MSARLRVVEWFCGIGGASAALGPRADVVMAVDVSRKSLAVFRHNFAAPVAVQLIEGLSGAVVAAWDADLWWMSPPCQPYTRRGNGADLDDPRAASFKKLVELVAALRPRYVALENVPPFGVSRARGLLCDTLDRAGYSVWETLLCPTALGIPNRRRRYYLVASRDAPLVPCDVRPAGRLVLRDLLDRVPESTAAELALPAEFAEQYRYAIHVVDPRDDQAVAACFTANYHRSRVLSGSYLLGEGGLRRFSPREILRLLQFPDEYTLPPGYSPRQAWPLVGNSLSVATVRRVLATVPELAGLADASGQPIS